MIVDLSAPSLLKEEHYLFSKAVSVKKKLLSSSDGVFIHGKRGTGKTTVLLTLKELLKEEGKLFTLPMADLSANVQSLILYLLAYIKEVHYEKLLELELEELFYKLEKNFPVFLKCFPERASRFLCEKDLSELLDKNELSYLETLQFFLKEFLRGVGKERFVLLVDDFDLSLETELLARIVVELSVFLKGSALAVVGAGDLENLEDRLFNFFKRQLSEEKARELSRSYTEKLFPLQNVIELTPVRAQFLLGKKPKITLRWEKGKGSLEELLAEHPTFKEILGKRKEVLTVLFDGLPLRKLVQFLKAVEEKTKRAKEGGACASEVALSEELIALLSDRVPYGRLLKFELSNKVGEEAEPQEVWSLFRSLNEFLKALFEREKPLREALLGPEPLRFMGFLKSYNREVYALLYLWLLEALLYGGKAFYPLFATVLGFIYGLPSLYGALRKGSPAKVSFTDYLKLAELTHPLDYDDSMNMLLAASEAFLNLRVAKMRRFLLFGKLKKASRGADLHVYYYRLPLSAYAYKEPSLVKKEFIYDLYSYDLPEEGVHLEKAEELFLRKLSAFRHFYRERLLAEPELLDRRVENVIRRSFNVVFKNGVTNKDYKSFIGTYLPFLLLVVAFESYDDFWASAAFRQHLYRSAVSFEAILKEVEDSLSEEVKRFFTELLSDEL